MLENANWWLPNVLKGTYQLDWISFKCFLSYSLSASWKFASGFPQKEMMRHRQEEAGKTSYFVLIITAMSCFVCSQALFLPSRVMENGAIIWKEGDPAEASLMWLEAATRPAPGSTGTSSQHWVLCRQWSEGRKQGFWSQSYTWRVSQPGCAGGASTQGPVRGTTSGHPGIPWLY